MLSETYEPFKPKGRLERVMETSTCAIFVTRGAGALDDELALAWRLALNLGAMEQARAGSTKKGILVNEATRKPSVRQNAQTHQHEGSASPKTSNMSAGLCARSPGLAMRL